MMLAQNETVTGAVAHLEAVVYFLRQLAEGDCPSCPALEESGASCDRCSNTAHAYDAAKQAQVKLLGLLGE